MELKTINIRGREYVTVAERVRAFNELFPEGSIQTEYWLHDKTWVVKATVSVGLATEPLMGRRTFTGLSQAVTGAGVMGQVALEVAETSAVGRALGFLGIGAVDGIASADEMAKTSPVASKIAPTATKPATTAPVSPKPVKSIQEQIMAELLRLEPRIGKETDAAKKKAECEATVSFYTNLKLIAENYQSILEKLRKVKAE